MKAAGNLRYAREKAGLTQRQLAERAGVPQSTIGRIECGLVDPRISTLDRLLKVCGFELDVTMRRGIGVDRTQFREQLATSPDERLARAAAGARFLRDVREAMRSATSKPA